MDPIFIIGQIFGIIAIVLGFLSYQMKDQRKLMILLGCTALVFTIHYLMIGAMTGMALNIVVLVRCIVYYFRNKKGSNEKISPIIFAVILVAIGIFTWEDWYSVFILLGLAISTLCMALPSAQKIRYSILVTSPLVIIYNLFALSFGGIVFEVVVIVSSIIGIIKYRKSAKN